MVVRVRVLCVHGGRRVGMRMGVPVRVRVGVPMGVGVRMQRMSNWDRMACMRVHGKPRVNDGMRLGRVGGQGPGHVRRQHGLLRRSQRRPRRDVRHARIFRMGMGVIVGVGWDGRLWDGGESF